jgi:hypothetical protein
LGGHAGINRENVFMFKYSGLNMEQGVGGELNFVHADPRNVLVFG